MSMITDSVFSVTQYDRLLYALEVWEHVALKKSPDALAPRIRRAAAIVRQEHVQPVSPGHYTVVAQCQSGFLYHVFHADGGRWGCDCMDRFRPCKHTLAVRAYRKTHRLLQEQWIAEWQASAHTELGIATKFWTPDHTDFVWIFQSPAHRQPCAVPLHALVLCEQLSLLAGEETAA